MIQSEDEIAHSKFFNEDVPSGRTNERAIRKTDGRSRGGKGLRVHSRRIACTKIGGFVWRKADPFPDPGSDVTFVPPSVNPTVACP